MDNMPKYNGNNIYRRPFPGVGLRFLPKIAIWRYAYTLIEVMVCVLIAGVLACVATVSLKSVSAALTLQDACSQITHMDYHARDRAMTDGRPQRLEIDPQEGNLQLIDPTPEGPSVILNLRLPSNYELFCMFPPSARGASPETEKTTGPIQITISPEGTSITYAIGILNSKSKEERWLIVAGMTGQVQQVMGDQDDVSQRLMLLHTAGVDSH
jgi:prepilin-type N-terminal cleavage/methylation domain-containing protein